MPLKSKIQEWCDKLNRKAKFTIAFYSNGETFSAYSNACKRVQELGFLNGPLCGGDPVALAKSVSYIAKWRNIPEEDYGKIEGLILSEDYRYKESAIVVFE